MGAPGSPSTVDFDEYQNAGRVRAYGSWKRRCHMRFYFDIRDRLAILDEVGRDFKLASEAVVYAKYLAADLRCLEPYIWPQLSIQAVPEGRQRLHADPSFPYTLPAC